MANNFQVQINVKNIGPHFGDREIDFKDKVDSNKAIFYALNGTGKTFVSRAIRLSEFVPDDFDASRILSIGTSEGNLSFSVLKQEGTKTLSVGLEAKKPPVIANGLDLKFHVFNSDFIEENVRAKSFSPDGNIDGYILGKIQIDISDEKDAEGKLKKEIEALSKGIDEKISSAKKELQSNGVQATTVEMRLFARERIKLPEEQDVSDTFEQIIAKMDTLKNVPENLSDVSYRSYSSSIKLLDEIAELISTEYPLSSWDEEFVSEFKRKREFVETGLSLSAEDKVCPFCGRGYDDEALVLVRKYRAYLADRQAQIHKRIETCLSNVQKVRQGIQDYVASSKASAGELSQIALYFPSVQQEQLVIPSLDANFERVLTEIERTLNKKNENISSTFSEGENWRDVWSRQEKALLDTGKSNEDIIRRVNKTKNNANGERLTLRRNLCKVKYSECCKQCETDFISLEQKSNELKMLQGSIKYKEQQARVSKKDKVYETLTYLLNQFFYEKYTIDQNTFEIQFLGKRLGKTASNVLSDGEKGIVAFCLYLAYVHQLVDAEDDYEKLFFVIDDPISSMDFNYVYAVAQTLREIKSIFNIQGHERIWVFTHNLEFLSIIARNHVIPNVYLMTPGNIAKYDYKLLMPYESHLHDIVCIADQVMQPSHTTGNSIRHVIETIAKFEDPQIGLDKYMQGNSILSGNSAVFSLCQDLSHGNIRSELPYSPDIMVVACQAVKEFVNSKYPEQINNVKE